jgi:hypothetical protein
VKPFYTDDSGCILYHGQAEDVLPCLGQVQHLVCEPPERAPGRQFDGGRIYPIDITRLTLPHVARWALYMCPLTSLGQYRLATDGGWVNAGVWHGVREGAVGAVAIMRGEQLPRWPSGLSTHWEVGDHRSALVDLSTQVLMSLTQPGDSVLDPYTRDGDVLLAAKRLGRRGLGICSSAEACGRIARALSQAQLHMRFTRQPAAAQASLL